MENILQNSKHCRYAFAPGKNRTWKLSEGKREYIHGVPMIDEGDQIAIRWGWRGYPLKLDYIQDTWGMNVVANKCRFRMWAQENKVSVPRTWVKGKEPEDIVFPVVGRPAKHTKGKDFNVYNSQEEYNNSNDYYYSRLIEKESEWRVYVFEGRIFCVSEKIPAEGVGPHDPWNHSIGNAIFKIKRLNSWPLDVCHLALGACVSLELLVAGVDVIVEDKKPYIVEINTAPAISGKLKPQHLGKLLDSLIERKMAGEDIKINQLPEGYLDVRDIRHPVLYGG